MASFQKNQNFVLDLFKGVHQFHAAGHTFKVYGSNATPDLAADAVKADLAEITAENGYPAGGSDAQNDCSQTSGTLSVTTVDVVWTASGGTFGPMRYVWLYNDTPTSPADPLVGGWDYGSSETMAAGEDFTVDFGATVLSCS